MCILNHQKKTEGKKLTLPSSKICRKFILKIKISSDFNNEEYEYIKRLNPDVVVVVAFGKILPKKILDINNVQFLNVHASLLPKWRGAAPIQRAIMNLDKTSGISIMKIVSKLDSGPTLIKSEIPITNNTNFVL